MKCSRVALALLCVLTFVTGSFGNQDCISPQYLERGTIGVIQCTFYEKFYGIFWYNSTNVGQVESIMTYVEFSKNGIGFLSGEYDIRLDGSLIIRNVSLRHETTFTVLVLKTKSDPPTHCTVDVIITVTPSNVYPAVQGCDSLSPCVLEVPREGNLTCVVENVRPPISLEWKPRHGTSSVTFVKTQFTGEEDGDTYNLFLKSHYRTNGHLGDNIVVSCNAFHTNITTFNRSTEISLIIVQDQQTNGNGDQEKFSQLGIISLCISLSALLILVCGVTILGVYWNRRKSKWRKVPQEQEMSKLEASGDEKQNFVMELQENYRGLFNAVQPVPYIRDRWYRVDQVFVEGGVQCLPLQQSAGKQNVGWKNMNSYQEIFRKNPDGSTRKIVEADPGYGKSTLTLQFAYEWCNKTHGCVLSEVELLILLRLRQLGGVSSIYVAIRKYILPSDSKFHESDIERLISNSKSVVVMLDGFDEYPDKESESDVMKVIRNTMLQNVTVLLTTRSSCLPKDYAPFTNRYRLTGFDEQERCAYIKKAVVGENEDDAKNIQQIIRNNPAVRDLCHVPLFFFMFVHMCHESNVFQKFRSVTNFFGLVIECFHSHMKNKLTKEDIKKYELFPKKHHELDKVAFDGLLGNRQNIVWSKNEFREKIVEDFYEYYVRVGILIEGDVLNISEDIVNKPIKYVTEVRFYHKIFCEWYAAHYLSMYIATQDLSQKYKHLKGLDPFEFQYLYRFSCGLRPEETKFILDYLKSDPKFTKFSFVCKLEQGLDEQELIRLFSTPFTINVQDNMLIQRSSIHLLEMASSNEIPIAQVTIEEESESASDTTESLCLTSQLSIPVLNTLEKLTMKYKGHKMSAQGTDGIIGYSSLCSQLKMLEFQNCLMPKVVKENSQLCRKLTNLQVTWYAGSGRLYILDFLSGCWKNKTSKNEIDNELYQKEKEYFDAKQENKTDVLLQLGGSAK